MDIVFERIDCEVDVAACGLGVRPDLVQALSGIAKDLTKMSSKNAIKFVVAEG